MKSLLLAILLATPAAAFSKSTMGGGDIGYQTKIKGGGDIGYQTKIKGGGDIGYQTKIKGCGDSSGSYTAPICRPRRN